MSSFPDYLHVAAAVIVRDPGEVLVARRPDHLHQGGLWEFPGGKVEAGEAVEAALVRELEEELGITPTQARPLIRIPHDYGDRKVLLDVWRVKRFTGQPYGREGQAIRWVEVDALADLSFPAANVPIVAAARLPDHCLITPEPGPPASWPAFLERLEARIAGGARLVQLRAKTLPAADYDALAREAVRIGSRYGAVLLLNAPPRLAAAIPGAGLHLTGQALREVQRRPLAAGRWLSAACHDEGELELARRAGADLLFVSPVKPTASHPGAPTLGWEGLMRLCEESRVPVYALGGMTLADREQAWRHGAQGIAAISALW